MTTRQSHPKCRPWLAAALLCLAGGAQAHDTWFEARPGEAVLVLGTGNQFPRQESAIGMEYLRLQGCRAATTTGTTMATTAATTAATTDATTAARPLALLRYTDTGTLFSAPAAAPSGSSCWAETTTFDIELPADKIAGYLDEVRATPAQRAAWAALQARGLPWKERYSKHARIELPGTASVAGAVASALASGLALELLLDAPRLPVQAGDMIGFRLLRDGAPLPGFELQLRSDRSRLGVWLRTDDAGRVQVRAPAAGAWLLRGIDLRLSATEPERWDSRFVSLAFTVVPRPPAP